jgi:hypothetical protein
MAWRIHLLKHEWLCGFAAADIAMSNRHGCEWPGSNICSNLSGCVLSKPTWLRVAWLKHLLKPQWLCPVKTDMAASGLAHTFIRTPVIGGLVAHAGHSGMIFCEYFSVSRCLVVVVPKISTRITDELFRFEPISAAWIKSRSSNRIQICQKQWACLLACAAAAAAAAASAAGFFWNSLEV